MGSSTVIGYQRWDSLLFLHWAVPPQSLRGLIHPRLELDTFDAKAWISATPFTVEGARPRFVPPLPLLSRFHELNARTYVKLEGEPGIWFFSLDAASSLASAIARASLHLPYCPARMHRSQRGMHFHFDADRVLPNLERGLFSADWEVDPDEHTARPGTLEHFLAERYVLFSPAAGDKLWRGPVRHRAWPLHEVRELRLEQRLDEADGLPPLGDPTLAQWSPGVDVEFLPFSRV